MATMIGIGFSNNPDPELAFKEASIEAKNELNLPSVDIVLVIFTSHYARQAAFEPIHRILHPVRLDGAMAPAIIVRDRVEPQGVAILAICSEEMKFGSFMLDHLSLTNTREAGIKTARDAAADCSATHRQGLLTFINNTSINTTPLLLGLQESVGRAFTITGGFCCDEKFGRGALLHKGILSSDGILGILIGGSNSVCVSARHGWKPLGKPRIVDHADGNLIRLIDKKPAVSLYQDYFTEELKNKDGHSLGNIGLLYPIGISTSRPKEYLIRNPIEVLPDGGIVCQSDVPVGSRIHLMISDKDSCKQSAHDAAVEVRDQLAGRPPKLVLILQSVARRKLVGRSITQELNIIKDILGLTVPILGMYTYGEIAPLGASLENRTSELQNASIVIIGIG